MLHSKGIHYPHSGFAHQRSSPPVFICSSSPPISSHQGSDDNVYEELENRNQIEHSRLTECDQQMHSDDDFAESEYELSLPGDRFSNISSVDKPMVATIYHTEDRTGGVSNANQMFVERTGVERNSLKSDMSNKNVTTNHNRTMKPNIRNSSSSNDSNYHRTVDNRPINNVNHHDNDHRDNCGRLSNFFRFKTTRPISNNKSHINIDATKNNHCRNKTNSFNMINLNSNKSDVCADEIPLSTHVGEYFVNKRTGSPSSNSDPISCSSNSLIRNKNHNEGDTNNNSNRNNYFDVDSQVERRNRINAQLSNSSNSRGETTMPALNVATIFRDHNSVRSFQRNPPILSSKRANSNYYAPPHQVRTISENLLHGGERLSRTNSRTDHFIHCNNNFNDMSNTEILNNVNNNGNANDEEYLYHEPVYNENLAYDPYIATSPSSSINNNNIRYQIYHQPYILPELSSFRNLNNFNDPHQSLYDSSTVGAINSDSGYSQNTQNSGRSLINRKKLSNNSNNSTISTSSIIRTEAVTTDDLFIDS